MNNTKQTEILSGIGIFFAVWTLTFLYSSLMQPVGFSQHYWFTATAFFIATGCLLSSFIIKQPVAIAPGLGVGWFAAHQILPQSHLLNFYLCIFVTGIILMVISQLKAIKKANQLLPNYLQATMSIGIGTLFMRLALEQQYQHMQSFYSSLLFVGTIFLLLFFKIRQNRWGSLITVACIIILGLLLQVTHWHGVFSKPTPLKTAFDLSSYDINWHILARQILEMSLFSFFDVATGIFCLRQITIALHMHTHENILSKGYLTTGLNNLLSSFFLCGPNTVFIESAFGMQLGGRKPLTLWVTSFCFIIFIFCFPLGQMIPKELFRGIFFFIGLSLLAPIYQFKKQTLLENAISILLIAIIIATKSILNGLLIGIILHYVYLHQQKTPIEKINHLITALAMCSLILKFI